MRINLSTQEIEVEGPEEFVERHIAEFLEAKPSSQDLSSTGGDDATGVPDTFGEFLQTVSSTAGTDRMLLAGWFVQQRSSDRLFTTRETSQLLREQGIRLGNPSQTAANLLKAKLIFRESRKFRVARSGEERIREILASE